jgi:hypothetical protein
MTQVGEKMIANTLFGTVTDRRVTYFRNKSWFTGGSQQDLPLRHVTSVRVDVTRSIFGGLFFVVVAFIIFGAADGASKVIALLPLALGILVLWGSPKVVVNTAGGDLNAATSWPWTRDEAESFASALRGQLFKD